MPCEREPDDVRQDDETRGPDRLYEAAKLDGASTWRMMRDITIPQMQNPLIFVVIVTFVGSFQVFGQPFIMTDGGPSFETTTIVLYLYDTAFTAASPRRCPG